MFYFCWWDLRTDLLYVSRHFVVASLWRASYIAWRSPYRRNEQLHESSSSFKETTGFSIMISNTFTCKAYHGFMLCALQGNRTLLKRLTSKYNALTSHPFPKVIWIKCAVDYYLSIICDAYKCIVVIHFLSFTCNRLMMCKSSLFAGIVHSCPGTDENELIRHKGALPVSKMIQYISLELWKPVAPTCFGSQAFVDVKVWSLWAKYGAVYWMH